MRSKLLVTLVLFLFSGLALAVTSPVEMLQNTSNQMLSALKKAPNRNNQTLYAIVEKTLLPNIDLDTMSRGVLGSTYWNQATSAQRNEFKQQFTRYITQTYSGALSAYRDETVKFYPVRGGFTGKTQLQVQSEISQSNGQSIPVSYKLILIQGQWKVFDFSVDGVSLVENYRAQFANVLRSQGLAGLLQQLKAKTMAS